MPCAVVAQQKVAAIKAPAEPKQWEYLVVSFGTTEFSDPITSPELKQSGWRLIAHHDPTRQEHMVAWSRREERIALGWGDVGDVSTHGSWREIREALTDIPKYRRDLSPSNFVDGGHSLWIFRNEMRIGDKVIIRTKEACEAVVEVTGDYDWQAAEEAATFRDYQHQRKARIIAANAERLWQEAGRRAANGFSIHWALIPVGCLDKR
jgi:hypothetical protein